MGENKKLILFLTLIVIYITLLLHWDKTDYIYINLMEIDSGKNLFTEIFNILYRYIIAFTAIALVFLISNYIKKFKITNFFKVIGKYTLEIYLFQNIIVSIIYRYMIDLFDYSINSNSLLFIIYCLFASFLFIILCISVINSPILKNEFLNKIFFGRYENIRVVNNKKIETTPTRREE